MRVDAHHHVWAIARGDYAWMSPDLPIHRDYGIPDLRPLLGDITATILVQAADTEAETAYMLDVARASGGLVGGVVGWTDLVAPDAPDRIAALAADPLLKGLRPMLQDIADTSWILRPDARPALDAMQRAGLRLDLLVKPRHLPILPALAQRHPALPMVIDHAAKPDIANRAFGPWAEGMSRLARETQWHCKLSGLITEAAPGWTAETLRPYVDHLLAEFGPSRLIWGSDWPVCTLAGSYADWRAATLALLPASARDDILGATAARFYGLDP
jgi:L-fuconolactonase